MRELTIAECESVSGGHDDHEHTPREIAAEQFMLEWTGDEYHCEESGTSSSGNVLVTCTPVE